MELETRKLLDWLFDNLERIDYYVVLGVERSADEETIRQAFYQRAEIMHPDRHYHIVDTDLREKLYVVYKRVAEAYRVLSGATSRGEYDQQLGAGRVRYQPDTLKDIPKDPEMSIRNLRARKLYVDAKAAVRDRNLQGAHLALQMAAQLEPGNAAIEAFLHELTHGRPGQGQGR
jgi:curved DNA-binding protein CbpA